MARRHKRRESVKMGMPPGTLVYLGEERQTQTQLTVFDYDGETLNEIPSESLQGCLTRKEGPKVTWINVDGLQDVKDIEQIGRAFGIHPLVLEDIVNTGTRPKFEDYENHLFVIVKMLSWDDKNDRVIAEHLSLVLGNRFLLTFQEKGGDVFDPVRERLRANRGRLRKSGADYLMYTLLDAVIDNYFVILEKLDDRIDTLEVELTADADTDSLRSIHSLRREMIELRRAVWPLREVIGGVGRSESNLIEHETHTFLRDVYDHTVQVVETIETFRDLLAGMLDIYMSTLNNRMNAVMKVLTIISTIFIPLNFIAGVYGMNFKHMPELERPWAYPLVLSLMLAVGLIMLHQFKKRKWF
jgi:magnesium transporter